MNYFWLLCELYRQKRNTKRSRNQVLKLQKKKLHAILHYAYRHSEYYRRTFDAAGITDVTIDTVPLSAFPSIDKTTLLTAFDELVTVSDVSQADIRTFDEQEQTERKLYKEKYHVVHSSGSTGKPGYFLYDEKAWNSMLVGIIRAALWDMSMVEILNLLKRVPRILYIAATDGRYGGAMAVGDGIEGVRARQLHLDIKTPLSEWIPRINEFQPDMIIGYPSAIKILGELVEQGDIKLNIIRVISCGEPLGAGLRKYLANVFQEKVINFYGASESLAIGVESDSNQGMFLFDDMNVIEVQNGEMYLTSLYNFAQPLIRYRLTDDIKLTEPDENSRYPFTRAVGLLGRSEDILWFTDTAGRREFLHPLAVEGICIEGIKDYQFCKTSDDSFTIYVEKSLHGEEEWIKAALSEQIEQILEEKNMNFVAFTIDFTEEIVPNSQTGKKNLVITDNQVK